MKLINFYIGIDTPLRITTPILESTLHSRSLHLSKQQKNSCRLGGVFYLFIFLMEFVEIMGIVIELDTIVCYYFFAKYFRA